MRILTFCQAAVFAAFCFATTAQAANPAAEEHYKRGVALGEAAEHANLFSRFNLAKRTRSEFERAVQIDPDFTDARMALVEYYLQAPHFLGGGDQKAIEQAREVLKRDAADGHFAFGRINEHQKNYAAAEKEYEDSLRLATDTDDLARAYMALGRIYDRLGNQAKAQASFAKARATGVDNRP